MTHLIGATNLALNNANKKRGSMFHTAL